MFSVPAVGMTRSLEVYLVLCKSEGDGKTGDLIDDASMAVGLLTLSPLVETQEGLWPKALIEDTRARAASVGTGIDEPFPFLNASCLRSTRDSASSDVCVRVLRAKAADGGLPIELSTPRAIMSSLQRVIRRAGRASVGGGG